MARLAELLGQSGGLTAREAGRRAAQTSVQAQIEHERIAVARNERARVIWGAVPQLTLSADARRLSPIDPFVIQFDPDVPGTPLRALENNYVLNARVSLPLSDYLLRMVKALNGAAASEDAAVLGERAARVTAAANAQLVYYDWVRALLAEVLAEQALEQAEAQLRRVRALHAAGRAAEADLLQAVAFRADAELARSQAQTQQSIAEERLRIALHAPPEETLRVGEDVLAPFPGAEEARSLEELYREARSQRLELQALQKNREAAERLRSVDATRVLPRLEAVGNLTYANPNQRVFPQQERWDATWDVGLSLVWSIADMGTGRTGEEAARSQRDQLVYQRSLVEEGLRLEVASAYRALERARVNVVTAEQGERAAAAALEARTRLTEQGMATELELMQAQTAQAQARLNLINAHIELRAARVQLDHAVGRDVGSL